MNRTHEYDDDLNTPPNPPWWRGLLALLVLVAGVVGIARCGTSCACTITCRPDIPRATEIIETLSAK